MKVTNLTGSTLFLRGLKFVREAQNNGGRGEDRYLAPGASAYLLNTTEVLRSAKEGELYAWAHSSPPKVELEDTDTLDPGQSVSFVHGFGFPPAVYALKQVADTWVDAMGAFDATHDESFNTVTFANPTEYTLTYYVRLL